MSSYNILPGKFRIVSTENSNDYHSVHNDVHGVGVYFTSPFGYNNYDDALEVADRYANQCVCQEIKIKSYA